VQAVIAAHLFVIALVDAWYAVTLLLGIVIELFCVALIAAMEYDHWTHGHLIERFDRALQIATARHYSPKQPVREADGVKIRHGR
jgi:hypothetical protein